MRQAEYVAVTGRHPVVTDAYTHGFLPGFRQHTSGFQADDVPNVDLPVLFLDNDFRDPDLDQYLELAEQYAPDVAVIGDATTMNEAERYQRAADQLTAQIETRPVIVPKAGNVYEAIADETVFGWPNGYAEMDPLDYSALDQWRGENVHILGGSPHDQLDVINLLTQPTIDDQDPANIVGLDGNGFFKAAYFGEYWTPTGYEPADWLSIRETVDRSLQEIKAFWQAHGIWPNEEPIETYGPAVQEPDDPVYATGDDIRSQTALEHAIVEDYTDSITRAYMSETEQAFVEYRDRLTRTGD